MSRVPRKLRGARLSKRPALRVLLLLIGLAVAAIGLALSDPAARPRRSHQPTISAPMRAERNAVAGLPPATQQTVRRFLTSYLRYLYGHGAASAIRGATAAFLRSLERHPPRVPPALKTLQPSVIRLTPASAPPGRVAATATISDGETVTYRISLLLTSNNARPLVSGLDG
jgi:hypothetical protein